MRELAGRLHALQIDSVNVLVRAQYLPPLARLGPYPRAALDSLAYERHELFEYRGHEACLLAMSLYPLLRYRMRTDQAHEYLQSPRGAYVARVHAEVAEHGPLTVGELADPGPRDDGRWSSRSGKDALEYLYDSGLLAIAGRRGAQRLYDLAERVIPAWAREARSPSREAAMKELIRLGARACGVGTLADVADYFEVDGWRDRLPPGPYWERQPRPRGTRARPIGGRLVSELVDEGRLLPAAVEGWQEPAYLHPEARIPATGGGRALVGPFDSLIWSRDRTERLFGMRYRIELYTPTAKRVHGYYVLPFLLGDALVARCDLRADRRRGALVVQGAFLEPGQEAERVASELAAELRRMSDWLELGRVEVVRHGDLGTTLHGLVNEAAPS